MAAMLTRRGFESARVVVPSLAKSSDFVKKLPKIPTVCCPACRRTFFVLGKQTPSNCPYCLKGLRE